MVSIETLRIRRTVILTGWLRAVKPETSVLAILQASTPPRLHAFPSSACRLRSMITRLGTPPVVVASANGHRFTNGGTKTCVETAFERIAHGDDVLDALIAGVNIVELDPLDDSVGLGGLPNADG